MSSIQYLVCLVVLTLCLVGCHPAEQRGRVHERSAEAKTTVILTFDDGPVSVVWRDPQRHPASEEEMLADLRRILEVLERRGIEAVFYVVYVEADPNAPPDSPMRSPERMRAVFARGCRAIHDAGHIIAMHAVDHEMYQDAFLTTDEALDDLRRLRSELDATSVPYARTWRIPYGGMRAVFYNPDETADMQDITIRGWAIDSQDWTVHHDAVNLLNRHYADDRVWLENVKTTLWRDVGRHGVGADPWADVLLHVNAHTAAYLESIIRTLEEAYIQHYGATHWERVRWLRTDNPDGMDALTAYLGEKP